jgi:hypothetical protein
MADGVGAGLIGTGFMGKCLALSLGGGECSRTWRRRGREVLWEQEG